MRKVLAALFVPLLLAAQEKIDTDTNARLRQQEAEHSEAMQIARVLTDRYGPRLTGSPNHEAAAKWAAAKLTEWGLNYARLEAWDFGHPGWTNERAAGYLLSPVKENLKFEVLSWTPSTKGTVTASAVQVFVPQGPEIRRPAAAPPQPPLFQPPTREELNAWMDANKALIAGKIVLVGKAAFVPVSFNPPAMRMDEARLRQQYDPNNPSATNTDRLLQMMTAGRVDAPGTPTGRMTTAQVNEAVDAWLVANGALMRINDAGMKLGEIRAFHNRTYDVAKAVPTVVLRNEDFGRIERLLADKEEVRLEFNIVNNIWPEGKTTYNVVAEIPGTDRADEVVMLGAHLDSWHAATGATDNATGAAVMMEAVRLIQTLGVKPRRTIRIALWSAEEQGLLGSKAYIQQHFGAFEKPKPDYSKFVAYFNVDSGTGRIRGASVFGPPEAAAVLRAALAPFEDLGVVGASATRNRVAGSTDSASFNAAGLAGINMAQDPIEYNAVTWHTNLDTYERIVPEDMKQMATVVAAAVWHVANREEPLPRFSREQMPPPAPAR